MKTKFFKWLKRNLIYIVEIIVLVGFYASFVFLRIGLKNNWEEKKLFSILVLFLFFAFVIVIFPLLKREKSWLVEKIVVGFCFVFLVYAMIIVCGVVVDTFKEPAIQILASCTGGFLTLYGVGLTIKHNRLEKEKDELERAKPNIFVISSKSWKSLNSVPKLERKVEIRKDLSCSCLENKKDKGYAFSTIHLANSDLSMCDFKGLVLNENELLISEYDHVLLRASYNSFVIDYKFLLKKGLTSIKLIVDDMLNNTYFCEASFEIEERKNIIYISINGIKRIGKVELRKYKKLRTILEKD